MDNTPLNPVTPPLPVWWLIWGGITAAFFMVIGVLESGGLQVDAPPALTFLALAPFAASAIVRFLILPNAEPAKKFVLFIVGLALAESGGFLALILGSPWKIPFAAAAIVLIIVHIPAFIRRT